MSYVITSACVADYACVDVCPVNCISPTPTEEAFNGIEQLYINPAVCINCAACVEACPVEAIFEERSVPKKYADAVQINEAYFSYVEESRA